MLQVNVAVLVEADVLNLYIKFLRQGFNGMKNGMMLYLRADEALDPPILGGILEHKIVSLTSARGENDL